MTRIALLNDTGSSDHVGCLAVTRAHAQMLEQGGIAIGYCATHDQWHETWTGTPNCSVDAVLDSRLGEHLAESDAIVVNGEGTIHHGFGPNLLAALAAGQHLGKPTFLVNALVQDCPYFHDTLRDLDDLTVRDAKSATYLKRLRIAHRLVPDSILECEFSPEANCDYGGRVVFTDTHPAREADVGQAMSAYREKLGDRAAYYPLEHLDRRTDYLHAVASLSTASLLVSARHHGIYLAAMAGIPFVALGSNSWKIEGLLRMFGRRIRECTHLRSLERRCREALAHPGLYREFAAFLQSHRPLSTFEGLPGWTRVPSQGPDGY